MPYSGTMKVVKFPRILEGSGANEANVLCDSEAGSSGLECVRAGGSVVF